MTAELERSHVEEARREKRDRLEALGVSPYAYRYARSHTAAEALALWEDAMGEEGPEIRVAGRLAGIRTAGKTVFAHVEDVSGRIQVYLRRQDLEPSGLWSLVDLLDLDDHVGVVGRLFRTRTGEVTVRAVPVAGDGQTPGLMLLSKSLRPLPRGKVVVQADGTRQAFSGLTDPEIRYRQRYADLAVHPEVRDVFRLRAAVIRHCREFLDARGFL
ncbi:MAG: OB-fold nucleic acid binding domain-containing protein, partial [Gemmatimonadales bacterium]